MTIKQWCACCLFARSRVDPFRFQHCYYIIIVASFVCCSYRHRMEFLVTDINCTASLPKHYYRHIQSSASTCDTKHQVAPNTVHSRASIINVYIDTVCGQFSGKIDSNSYFWTENLWCQRTSIHRWLGSTSLVACNEHIT